VITRSCSTGNRHHDRRARRDPMYGPGSLTALDGAYESDAKTPSEAKGHGSSSKGSLALTGPSGVVSWLARKVQGIFPLQNCKSERIRSTIETRRVRNVSFPCVICQSVMLTSAR
jgi:hypothetical protein